MGDLIPLRPTKMRQRSGFPYAGLPMRNDALKGSVLNYIPVNDEAVALLSRMTTEPSNTRKKLIDETVTALKTAGVWAKLDCLWIMAAHESPSGLLNWIKNANNLTLAGTTPPEFIQDKGFRGDGISGYIDTNYNPATQGINFTLNSALFAVGTPSNKASAEHSNGAVVSLKNCMIVLNYNTYLYSSINISGSAYKLGNISTTRGYSIGNRISATQQKIHRNKVISTISANVGEIVSAKLAIGAVRTSASVLAEFNTNIYSFACTGATLSDLESNALIDAVENYMKSVNNPINGEKVTQSILPIDIIGGQSNAMAQFCHLADIPVGYSSENENILVWDHFNGNWNKNYPGVTTFGKTVTAGYTDCWASEQPFVYSKLTALGNKVAFIKNAKGSQRIAEWAQPSGAMWLELKTAIEGAIANAVSQNSTPRFDSFLWVHGESDIIASTNATTYKNALVSLINATRALDATTANVKFVLVKVASGLTGLDDTRTAALNAKYDEIASEVTGVLVIDIEALTPTFADSLHYTPATILSIGESWFSTIYP